MKNEKDDVETLAKKYAEYVRAMGTLGIVGEFLVSNEAAIEAAKLIAEKNLTGKEPELEAIVNSLLDMSLSWIALHKAVKMKYGQHNDAIIQEGNETVQ